MRKELTVLLFIIVIMSCGGYEKPKTAEELKYELQMTERTSPLDFLSSEKVTLQYQEKLIQKETFFKAAKYAPDGALVEGLINNKATLAKYKDVVVKVSFYSQTKTLIKDQSYVIYDFFKPNSTKKFSIKVQPPQATKSFDVQIVDATAVYE